MLLRGQNLVGYRHYPDDVVEKYVAESARQGVDIFRVFDALNDPRNMEVALRAVRKSGARAQGTICYTQSPVHTLSSFVKLGRRLAEMGADELCVKDMGGFLPPTEGGALVRALVREVGLPVVVHTHSASGMSSLTCLAAADLQGRRRSTPAISPFAGARRQPPTEALVGAMRGTPVDPHLDLAALAEIRRNTSRACSIITGPFSTSVPFRRTRASWSIRCRVACFRTSSRSSKSRTLSVASAKCWPRSHGYEPTLAIPARHAHEPDRRHPGGLQRARFGRRYGQITQEVRDYVRGLYGTRPGPVDPELQALVFARGRADHGPPRGPPRT